MWTLVLPDRWATSFIYKQRRAAGFWRFFGGCSGPSRLGTRPGLLDRLEIDEIAVGHENRYLPGRVCWQENDWVLRGAVRFPLHSTLPGFHQPYRAFLTWRMVDAADRVGGPFHHCTTAVVGLGRASWDWDAGTYANEPRHFSSTGIANRDNLETGIRLIDVDDTNVAVPGTSPHVLLRRVDVTAIVQAWIAGRGGNFGFVLKGDESFRRAPNSYGGLDTSAGVVWERCIAIYSGFELAFATIGETPPWGPEHWLT